MAPKVRTSVSLRRAQDKELRPEGLVCFEHDGAWYAATANENAGTVSFVRVVLE